MAGQDLTCGACGKSQGEANRLLVGNEAAICDVCARLSIDKLREKEDQEPTYRGDELPNDSARVVAEALSEGVNALAELRVRLRTDHDCQVGDLIPSMEKLVVIEAGPLRALIPGFSPPSDDSAQRILALAQGAPKHDTRAELLRRIEAILNRFGAGSND